MSDAATTTSAGPYCVGSQVLDMLADGFVAGFEQVQDRARTLGMSSVFKLAMMGITNGRDESIEQTCPGAGHDVAVFLDSIWMECPLVLAHHHRGPHGGLQLSIDGGQWDYKMAKLLVERLRPRPGREQALLAALLLDLVCAIGTGHVVAGAWGRLVVHDQCLVLVPA